MTEIIKIVSTKNDFFVDKFLKEYLSHGFGSMSKRDIDILVIHLLMEYADIKNINNFDLSMRLKLTETKIKNLKYEANLKYSKKLENGIKEEFLSLLKNVKLKVIGKETWISIVVEDTFLRNAIKAKVKENGSFTDSSFNSEIMKISANDFSSLIYEFSDDKEREDIEKELLELFPDIESISFKKLFKMFLEKAVEGAGGEAGKQGVIYLVGGTSTVVEVFKSLRSLMK